MKTNVLSLLLGNVNKIDVEFEEEIKNEKLIDERFEIISPVNVSGTFTIYDDVIRFEGSLGVTCKFVCDRCLEDFICDLETDFGEDYKKGVTDDDDDFMPIVNDTIDLDNSVIKNILANIPIRLVCSDDCKGIEYDKPETDEDNDSPFSVLKDIKF